jgi:hypothetical protein
MLSPTISDCLDCIKRCNQFFLAVLLSLLGAAPLSLIDGRFCTQQRYRNGKGKSELALGSLEMPQAEASRLIHHMSLKAVMNLGWKPNQLTTNTCVAF